MDKFCDYRPGLEIAVIGMAARLPGAKNMSEFLKNLTDGIESVEILTADELAKLNVEQKYMEDERYVKVRASLKNPDYFDAAFFGYSDEEAEIMDPQMRLLHECTWEALEHAGYDTEQYKGTVGLFVGGTPNPLWEARTLFSDQNGIMNAYNAGNVSEAYSKTLLHDKDLMSTRVAYKLNLRGPALTVFTSCSTSLVSVHLAVQSILSGECDIAVAGGVGISFPKRAGYFYEEGMIVSSDGHCRSFSENANGTVFGDGIGLLVLKRLENAIEDGDEIHALIRGSAVNNDGSNRIGYMAPGVEGQAEVMKLAMQLAEVEPNSIAFIEGHGSATKVGDSIEIEAMKSAFKNVERKDGIAIGSVKTNIGHLNSAAGTAGIIKTILSLKNRILFPSLHCEEPNPVIENSCFYVNNRFRDFEENIYPIRALVNSFGAGGTNASIVLEEPPVQQSSKKSDSPQLIVLSANTKSALKTQTECFYNFLRENNDVDFADFAYTLKVGRRSLSYRKYFAATEINEAIRILKADISGERDLRAVNVTSKKINTVFMFSGQGAQYVNMGSELYKTYRVFREEADRCFNILYAQYGLDMKSVMYPSEDYVSASRRINEIDVIQLAVFILEYSLSKLMLHWGIMPDILVGYSLGEVTAACIAGVFSLEDTLKIVNTRGKLMRSTLDGMMLSIPIKAELIAPEDGITVAIDNGASCVVSGTKEAIQAYHNKMKHQNILCIPVNSSHGAHSHLMEPVLDEFLQLLEGISFHEPRYLMISGITGKLLDNREVIKPSYWVRQLRETVMFAKGVNGLLNDKDSIFIEIGPGRDLTVLVNSFINNLDNKNRRAFAVDLVRIQGNKISDEYFILNRLGKLWQEGIKIDWNNCYVDEKRRRIPLPTYPFEGKSYWPESDTINALVNRPAENPVLYKEPLDDWFYVPSWKHLPLLRVGKDTRIQYTYLIFYASQYDLENEIVHCLRSRGEKVVTVIPGTYFSFNNGEDFIINPSEYEDYINLFETLKNTKTIPDKIIDLWPINDSLGEDLVERFKKAQELGLYSILKIVKAMEQCSIDNKTDINIITCDLHEITGEEQIVPENATLLSTAKIISQEYLHINCRCIDIHEDSKNGKKAVMLSRILEDEFSLPASDRIVAYRGKQRWIQVFETVKIERNVNSSYLKQQGLYLITGGLGDLGFNLAKHLIKTYNAKIVLLGRSDLSSIDRNARIDGEVDKFARLKELKNLGGIVLYYPCDVSDAGQTAAIIAEVERETGSINGVIHAAGIVGKSASAIKYITKEICEEQFKAKVYGLIALEKVFRKRQLDFCLLASSLSNILGGLGDTSYAAANIYMDYFVQTQRYKGQHYWLSVNWETWYFEKEQKNNSNLGINRIMYSMKVEEGIDTFDRIMSCLNVNRVLISSGNFQKRMDMWMKLDEVQPHIEEEIASNGVKPRPDLLSDYVLPCSLREKTLVTIWEKTLKVTGIGIMDDFFELGGDSLKAINMVANVRKEISIQIPLSDFFKNPTIKAISGMFSDSSTHQRYIIKPALKKQYYNASAAQKRLYILNQMEGQTTAYNEPIVVRLEGKIEKEKVQQVFERMVSRNEILRTGFDFKDNVLVQIIYDNIQVCTKHYHCSEENAEQVLKDFIQPFDLCAPPLMRLGFIDMGEDKSLLILDMHHIVTDGVSETIITRDFMELYMGKSLPRLTVQYKDFSEWQNEMRESGQLREQEEYWLKVFETEAPVLNMPCDFPRPPFLDYEGGIHSFTIDKTQSEMLRKLARSEKVTLYMLLIAAFNVFLQKLSGNEDIVIGTVVSGRNCDDLQNTVGMFVNTLPIRNYPKKEKKFNIFLEEVKESVLGAFNNQEYQFEELIEKLAITRDASRNPLFDIMFVWQNLDMPEIAINGINLKAYKYRKNVSKFDVSFVGYESEEGTINFDIEFASRLFKTETISRFAEYFKRIIDEVIKMPDNSLEDIDILTMEERTKILYKFNDTYVDYSVEGNLNTYIEENAELKANKVAVVCGERSITFKEFNEKANQVANLLIKSGVGANVIVGIVANRSIEMLVGIWGILKAGGAYLPIDPECPDDRKRLMLHDCGVKILLTNSASLDKVVFESEIIVVDSSKVEEYSTQNPVIRITPSDAAYVIFTSGSTGVPKGTLVQRNSLVNRLLWMTELCNISGNDVILQKTTYTFDVSVWEIVLPLVIGAKVFLAKPGGEKDPDYLREIIRGKGITVTHFVPSMLTAFLESHPGNNDGNKLRMCICSGEALTQKHKDLFFSKMGSHVEFYNLYGPTEAAIDVTYFKVSESDYSIPIGKPVANTKLYIMDEKRRLLPIGVMGDIYISGIQVGRGYINNPELTNNCFFEDHLNPGQRMYRTGDIGRWLENGNIEYIGRNDDQVKVRGFRIELGEIEKKILEHPDIQEAAVCVERINDNAEILMYFKAHQLLKSEEIRRFLLKSLPDYMIPSKYFTVGEFPTTSSGKIDRKLLRERGKELVRTVKYTAPENNLEIQIASVWMEVLHTDKIGVEENFFDAGGNSINLILVNNLLKTLLEIDIPVAVLFRFTTIRSLAVYLTEQQDGKLMKKDDELILSKAGEGRERLKQRRRYIKDKDI
ncbi:hypothetical protein acsn021_37420 [Anaerocolumna cellulosilytica]|uniref:Uncharacterized protein n=1 Tax=Anaerocolumna cellulosilytica TaxID=433286 RepID=A0A6S6QY85_9FIRM|nr:non-ribosomal peptide synthetase/type I polyketide synthase [Anaerocolumna cellulosilytica]MBB5194990.1 amino acid adenylation domain-containing protein [Anaerocolumna cellulosilytica]BCJ96173.1 hypothetical protein acsn021_37420 [Anaerocolumna cellulosilytica]